MARSFEPIIDVAEEPHKDELRNTADAFPKPTETESRGSLTIAKVEVRDPEHKWNGKTSIDAADTCREALKSVGPENELVLEERMKRYLIGFWGERVLAEIPIANAKTIYAGTEANPEDYTQAHQLDIETYTGITRKDLMIRRYYLAQTGNDRDIAKRSMQEFSQEQGLQIFQVDALEVIDLQLDVIQHYDKAVQAWQRKTGNKTYPNMPQLMRWAITDEIKRQQKERNGPWRVLQDVDRINTIQSWSEFMLNQQNELIFHDNDTLLPVKVAAQFQKAETELHDQITSLADTAPDQSGISNDKAARRIAHYTEIRDKKLENTQRYSNSYYFHVAIPDGVLIDSQDRVAGIMEIKCYTPSEVERWVELLKWGLENEPDATVHYGQEGLQVLGLTDPKKLNSPGMNFGFNPDAYSRFLNMVEGTPLTELSRIPYKGDRMVLRFTDDIPDETLILLGDTIQQYGYTDFIIQKVGLTEEDIGQIAQKILKRDLEAVKARVPEQGKRLMEKLARPESWQ